MKENKVNYNNSILFIIVSIIIFYWGKTLLGFGFPIVGDVIDCYYPWEYFVQKLNNPLWNPYNLLGEPFYANIQGLQYYIPSVVIRLLPINIFWQIQLFTIIHFIAAAIGMYLLLKTYNISETACVGGALLLVFSNLFKGWVGGLPLISAFIWLPFLLFFYKKYLLSYDISYLSGGIISTCLLFTSGHTQFIYYFFIYVTIYQLYTIFLLYFDKITNKKYKILKIIKYCFITNIVAVLFSTVQWLPILKFTLQSDRSGAGIDFAGSFGTNFAHLFGLVLPKLYRQFYFRRGNYFDFSRIGELQNYYSIGLLGFLLLIISLIKFKNLLQISKDCYFYVLISFIAIILSTGTNLSIINNVLYKFPGISFFRYPYRYLFIFNFSVIVLIAFVINYFSKKLFNKNLILFLLCIILFAIIFLFIIIYNENIFSFIINLYNFNTITIIEAKELISDFVKSILLNLIFNFIAVLFLYFSISKNQHKKYIQIIFVCIAVIFNSWLPQYGLIKYQSFREHYELPKSITEFLENDSDIYRVHFEPKVISDYIITNKNIVWKIEATTIHSVLNLQNTSDLLKTHNFLFRSLSGLANIKYLIITQEINQEQFELVQTENEINFYKNQKYIPRFRIVQDYVYTETLDDFIELSDEINFNNKTVFYYADYDKVQRQIDKFKLKKELENDLKNYENYEKEKILRIDENFKIDECKEFNEVKAINKEIEKSHNLEIGYFKNTETINNPKKEKGIRLAENLDETKVFKIYNSLKNNKNANCKNEYNLRIIKYSEDKIKLEIETTEPVYLATSNVYYPGWKCRINNMHANVFVSDGIFYGVFLDAGKHIVEFYFDPIDYKIGKTTSFITLVVLLFVFTINKKCSVKKIVGR